MTLTSRPEKPSGRFFFYLHKINLTIIKVNEFHSAMEEMSLEELRQKRIAEMKAKALKASEWRSKGHGAYSEVADQRAWFDATKVSERVVTHFYRPTTPLCELVDKHLALLAPKHTETRFIKINAEKAPFLAERLNIVALPTIIMTSEGFVAVCHRFVFAKIIF